jgi:hypothetical protein
MSDPLYQVIFRGKLLTGFSLEQVRGNLAALFKTDEARIGAQLAMPKWVIKAGIGKEQAQQIQERLRGAGLMVAILNDDVPSGSDTTSLRVANTAETSPQVTVNAPASSAPTVDAPPGQADADSTPSEQPDDAPLAVKPAVAPYNPDLSAFSLAEAGAIMDSTGPKKVQRNFDLAQFSLAEVGVQIIDKPVVAPKVIDLSHMALAPADIPVEPHVSPLWKEFAGE